MNKYKDKSESFIKKIITTARAIFETAVDNDLCMKNPAKNVRAEGVKPKEKEFFNEKEIEIIEKFCFAERSNISDELIVLLYTGLRREELLGLKWNDIDFENDTISINRAVIVEKGRKILKSELKNNSSRRVIPLLTEVREIFETRIKTPGKNAKSEFIFHDKNGEFQNPDAFRSSYALLMKRINRKNDGENQIRKLSPHCCRHTFATHLSKSGIDIKVIQSVLGHADISMTGNIYAHSTIDGIKKALDGFKY